MKQRRLSSASVPVCIVLKLVLLLLVVIFASSLCGSKKTRRLHGREKQDVVQDMQRILAPRLVEKGTSRRHALRLVIYMICGLVEVEL